MKREDIDFIKDFISGQIGGTIPKRHVIKLLDLEHGKNSNRGRPAKKLAAKSKSSVAE